ncbi:tRNA (adenosine(37)-N6)-threonylcarbamoyltransferase complex ATPase subunit type 1 TsaE, partial [Pelagibacteraceae bacterium]|nr:tRNA (adenosine(37)-N6)-threonylcarbamoyltransferase complex ATPase subunit type 1 TsaE [Pelagibacteraceae bacterium]
MHIATNSEIIDISLEVKTAELAKIFSKVVKKGDVVFFHGEIGVGKTTFIRHLVNCLQANNHLNQTQVTSPTFNLVNEYDVGVFIIQHYDLYRLTNSYETKNIGLLENQKEILTLIEWPEK